MHLLVSAYLGYKPADPVQLNPDLSQTNMAPMIAVRPNAPALDATAWSARHG